MGFFDSNNPIKNGIFLIFSTNFADFYNLFKKFCEKWRTFPRMCDFRQKIPFKMGFLFAHEEHFDIKIPFKMGCLFLEFLKFYKNPIFDGISWTANLDFKWKNIADFKEFPNQKFNKKWDLWSILKRMGKAEKDDLRQKMGWSPHP